jgi:DNA-directed RNA polymerase sigma subunit (sigma70/sigma32)
MEHDFVDDPIAVYVAELATIPPLSRVGELDCIRDVRAGSPQAEAAAKVLIEANLYRVVSIARRYEGRTRLPLLELIQAGNPGLVRTMRALSESDHDDYAAIAEDHIELAIWEAIASAGGRREE